jgi:hypothetical protein
VRHGVKCAPFAEYPIRDAELRLQFRGRGEFLVLYRPKSVDIPQPTDLANLSKVEKLNGMRLVTGTLTCPAYALFYSCEHSTHTVTYLSCLTPYT